MVGPATGALGFDLREVGRVPILAVYEPSPDPADLKKDFRPRRVRSRHRHPEARRDPRRALDSNLVDHVSHQRYTPRHLIEDLRVKPARHPPLSLWIVIRLMD
jgi:hypothetical protein